ncbi:MAG: hypothetical protein JST86_05415 [Bacteroidetes bacterium]|nr:hypothetical protein [Bacteroidota bacterium]
MYSATFNQTCDDFELRLSESLNKIWDYILDDKNRYWTQAVKQILSKESRLIRDNLKVAACNLKDSDCPEWLYDFVCYDYDNIGLKDVILVAESEWRNPFTNDYLQDIQEDFEKLLMARAKYRIMIFEGETKEEVETTVIYLQKIISNSKLSQPGDRYMFAGWIRAKEFYFHSHIHN